MQQLNDILVTATSRIAEPYFRLPIDGGQARLFERNYCYELYHQMRREWPDPCEYALNGEIDKRGHPLIRPMGEAQAIPDLLVHTPSHMVGNFAIIEVKTAETNAEGIAKDIRTLARFTRPDIHYQRAILLIFGGIDVGYVQGVAAGAPDHHPIELWTHDQVGHPAHFRLSI
jgi:hypothetical protein